MMSGKIKFIAIGAAAVLVLVVALFFLLRTTPQDIAEDFLAMIGKGEVEEAYGYIAPDLRARQNLDVFERAVEEMNLVNYASVSWDRIDDETDGIVSFSGQVNTKAGEKFPLAMTLIRAADGGWLVAQFGPPGAAPTTPPAP